MARTAKEFTVRRNEILDVAQRLVYTKGYEQMTIQDVLDGLQISKGAFYHYFRSKQDLLDAMIGHMIEDGENLILPIIQDPDLNALEKLRRYFDTVARWKNAQKTYLMAIMRIWYADDNAIVRQKMTAAAIQHISPLFTQIIRQGMDEGPAGPSLPGPGQRSGDGAHAEHGRIPWPTLSCFTTLNATISSASRAVWQPIPMRLSACWGLRRVPSISLMLKS